MEDFEKLYEELTHRPDVRAAVLISGKANGFIAGADIQMLASCKTAQEATDLALAGHAFFNKIENGSLPIVSAIHGDALGGGLEVAMATHYRIATTVCLVSTLLSVCQNTRVYKMDGCASRRDSAAVLFMAMLKAMPLLVTHCSDKALRMIRRPRRILLPSIPSQCSYGLL